MNGIDIKRFENYRLYIIFDNEDYKDIEDFSYGFALARHNNGVYGFIDKKGLETLLFNYDLVNSFYMNVAPVCRDDKWGFIDTNFEEIVPLQYEFLRFYKTGFIVKKEYSDEFILVNGNGKEVFRSNNYKDIIDILDCEVEDTKDKNITKKTYNIPYTNLCSYSYFNKDGNMIVPYHNVENRDFYDGYVVVRLDKSDIRIYNEFGKQLKIHTCLEYDAYFNKENEARLNSFKYRVTSKVPDGYSALITSSEKALIYADTKEELEEEINNYVNTTKPKVKRKQP